jgi:predicted small secreted protein
MWEKYTMRALKRVLAGLAVAAVLGVGAFGCNTVKGAGKDIQKGGQAIEKAADNVQKK